MILTMNTQTSSYEKPAVELVLLQMDEAVLQSSRAGASTQDLGNEEYEW